MMNTASFPSFRSGSTPGSYLEASFPIADLPSDTAAVTFDPFISTLDERLDTVDGEVERLCYPLAS